MSELLKVERLDVHYGGIQAVRDVSFSLREGEQATLIGANGAGKSSTVRAITGLERFGGNIEFNGKPVRKQKAEGLLRNGLVMVPEGRGIFARMTVLENLQMGAWLRRDTVTMKQEMDEIFDRFPRLGERQNQLAGLLSGGEQQLLALNRALLSQPRLLILDEPSMGLAPKMVENIFCRHRRAARARRRPAADRTERPPGAGSHRPGLGNGQRQHRSSRGIESDARRRPDCTDLFGRNARLTTPTNIREK